MRGVGGRLNALASLIVRIALLQSGRAERV